MGSDSDQGQHRPEPTATDRRILEELRDRILAARGERVWKLIVYGSREQGQATPGSDFDLLVVETDPVVPLDEGRRLRMLLEDLPLVVDLRVMGGREFQETKEVIGGPAYPAHKYGVVLNEVG